MNAAENYGRSALLRQTAYGIAAKRVAGVNADAYNVTRMDRQRIHRIQRFITNQGGTKFGGSRRRKHIQPAGGDYCRSECCITWVHKMNFHCWPWYLNCENVPTGRAHVSSRHDLDQVFRPSALTALK